MAQTWRLGSVEELFEAVETGSVRAAATLRGQSSQAMSEIKNAIGESMEGFRAGDAYELPMPAVLYSALKPRDRESVSIR